MQDSKELHLVSSLTLQSHQNIPELDQDSGIFRGFFHFTNINSKGYHLAKCHSMAPAQVPFTKFSNIEIERKYWENNIFYVCEMKKS